MDFTYHLPTRIVFGIGALQELPAEVERLGGKHCLLISDDTMIRTGILEKVTDKLSRNSCKVFSDVASEPVIEIAEKAIDVVRESDFDVVIGIGGGSVLDIAKLASGLATNPGKVESFVGVGLLTRTCIPTIMMPITAGTGSEVTGTSMISVEGHKRWIMSPLLQPNTALVDPDLTVSMPSVVTASTGLDALCHCTEAFLSGEANPITDSIAL